MTTWATIVKARASIERNMIQRSPPASHSSAAIKPLRKAETAGCSLLSDSSGTIRPSVRSWSSAMLRSSVAIFPSPGQEPGAGGASARNSYSEAPLLRGSSAQRLLCSEAPLLRGFLFGGFSRRADLLHHLRTYKALHVGILDRHGELLVNFLLLRGELDHLDSGFTHLLEPSRALRFGVLPSPLDRLGRRRGDPLLLLRVEGFEPALVCKPEGVLEVVAGIDIGVDHVLEHQDLGRWRHGTPVDGSRLQSCMHL